jgi:hypothetical protein
MEKEDLFGKLFNSVPLIDENHLELLLQTMDKSSAIYLIIQAVKHAYHSGIYSLGESEVLSKAIRVMSRPETDLNEKSNPEGLD